MELKVGILSVVYSEPEWMDTIFDLSHYCPGVPIHFTHRYPEGTGSLAEAINRGVSTHSLWMFDAIWIITNIRFGPGILPPLLDAMRQDRKLAAIHPAFESDHKFLQPGQGIVEAPFVEFTAPLVRGLVMASTLLDERMPYAGHDLDWGYRVRQKGLRCAVHSEVTIKHTYIRHAKPHPVTQARQLLRQQFEPKTKELIHQIYGNDANERLQKLGSSY